MMLLGFLETILSFGAFYTKPFTNLREELTTESTLCSVSRRFGMKRFNTKIGCLKLEESLFLKPRSGSYSGRDKSIKVKKNS
jgi:hypothetical protein